MPLRGWRRSDALAGLRPRHRPWRFRLAILVSLLIHAAIAVLLLVTIRRERQFELLPPPSAVTMLFESGRRTGPTLPEPGLQATPPPEQPASPEQPPAEQVSPPPPPEVQPPATVEPPLFGPPPVSPPPVSPPVSSPP